MIIFRGFVNVCLAYTSRAEVTAAMNDIRRGVQAGLIDEEYVFFIYHLQILFLEISMNH